MAFCSYCGAELAPGARFCSACGSPAPAEAVVPAGETAPAAPIPVPEPVPVIDPGTAEYSLVLYSIGTCAKSYADDVLEDILGYTDSEAKQILKLTPTQIARSLTADQAQYLAQALTEYGMQVLIYKGEYTVDLSQNATRSVFNSDGSLVTAALTAIAAITVANRVRPARRWSLTNVLRDLFTPRYRVTPPRHITRAPIRREPEFLRPAPPKRPLISRSVEPKRRALDVPRSMALNRQARGGKGPGGPGGGHGPGGRR